MQKVHLVDEVLPIPKLAAYGSQPVLAFYAGAVLVPIILAGALRLTPEQLIHLINADLFTCGIASLIQSVGIGNIGVRLPLLQGVTFTAVSPMIAIGLAAGGGTDGLLAIYGSVLCAGLFTFLVAGSFSKLVKFFPPVVTGSVILIIGVALLPVAANDIVLGASPAIQNPVLLPNLLYAFGTLGLIVVIQRAFTGLMATVPVLVGLVVGTLVAWVLGDAHFGEAASADWLGYTTPFYFETHLSEKLAKMEWVRRLFPARDGFSTCMPMPDFRARGRCSATASICRSRSSAPATRPARRSRTAQRPTCFWAAACSACST